MRTMPSEEDGAEATPSANGGESSSPSSSSKKDDENDDNDGGGGEGGNYGTWQELMGRDLMMKTERAPDRGVVGENDGGDDGDDDDDENHAKMHDVVNLDVVGRRIMSMPPDEDDFGDPGGYVLDGDDGEGEAKPFLEADGLMIALGEGDVCNGIEMAARFLGVGERGTVRCRSKYAYGPAGRRKAGGGGGGAGGGGGGKKDAIEYDLPPDSDVVFTVTVKSIVSAESPEHNTDSFRILRARAKKDLGNDCYMHEWHGSDGGVGKARALRLYKKAGEIAADLINENRDKMEDMRTAATVDREAEKEATAILVDCLNNASAAHMRAKDYGKAKEMAAEAIRRDPNNMKALLRAARAAMLDPAGTYEESDAAIRAAEEIVADNQEGGKNKKEVQRMRAELTRKKKEYKKREKDLYGKMMGGGAAANAAKVKVSDKEEANTSDDGRAAEPGGKDNDDDDLDQIPMQNREPPSLTYYYLLAVVVLCWSYYVTKFANPHEGLTDLVRVQAAARAKQGEVWAEETEF